MRIVKWLGLLGLCLSVSGCATGYHDDDNYLFGGARETRVNSRTMIVTYDATRFTPQSAVNDYVLYRAARATIDSGFHYFVIMSSSLPRTAPSGSARTASVAIKMFQGPMPPGMPGVYNAEDMVVKLAPAVNKPFIE